ncbi:MAG: ZIP family metal transporter [Clostridia bacterium]|nr:ZIP family metal transporter [Clostridia bacterium]
MEIVILTAFGVGASTVMGALLGFIFGKLSEQIGDVILAFGAGVMLWAAVLGLIIPSLEYNGGASLIITPLGVILGGVIIMLIDRLLPNFDGFLSKTCGGDLEECERRRRVLLFVLAIAIHNLPEGLASGVAFGTGDVGDALLVSLSIALQNIPEGMVLISPMISIGISKRKAFGYAALTGVPEVIGALVGYFTVSISSVLLPLFLSLAGGCMLYVITDEMIPETHSNTKTKAPTFALIVGFLAMVVFDVLV